MRRKAAATVCWSSTTGLVHFI